MPRLVSTRVPTAWIHFLVAELRPLYALWYAVYSFFKRGELEVSLYGVFGVPATNECWFSLGYYDCAIALVICITAKGATGRTR
jgi:hypothetical protein